MKQLSLIFIRIGVLMGSTLCFNSEVSADQSQIESGRVFQIGTLAEGNAIVEGALSQQDLPSEIQHGKVSRNGVDRAEGEFITQGSFLFEASVLVGEYGILSITDQGKWIYQLDYVAVEEMDDGTAEEVFTLVSKGGMNHILKITVEGDIEQREATSSIVETGDWNFKSREEPLINGISAWMKEVFHGLAPSVTTNETVNSSKTDVDQSKAMSDVEVTTERGRLSSDMDNILNDLAWLESGDSSGNEVNQQTGSTPLVGDQLFQSILNGWVAEDGVGKAEGRLSLAELSYWSPIMVGRYGLLSIEPSGNWSYQLDHDAVQYLDQGDHAEERFELIADRADYTIEITIDGREDDEMIKGTFSGEVSMNGAQIAEGTVQVIDLDDGEDPLFEWGTFPSSYGSLALSPEGHWRYKLDQDRLQPLMVGEVVTDTITLTTSNQIQQDIVITIKGPERVDLAKQKIDSALSAHEKSAVGREFSEHIPDRDHSEVEDVGNEVDIGDLSIPPPELAESDPSLAEGKSPDFTQGFGVSDGVRERTAEKAVNLTPDVADPSVPSVIPQSEIQVGVVVEDGHGQAEGVFSAAGYAAEAAERMGQYGVLTIDQQGKWSYQLDHTAVQYLDQGEYAEESFSMAPGSAVYTVHITIEGTADFEGGADTKENTPQSVVQRGVVTEDGIGKAEGTFTTGSSISEPSLLVGQYGVLATDQGGNWSYQLDHDSVQHLDHGDHAEDRFTFTSGRVDYAVDITIDGTEDDEVVEGVFVGDVSAEGTGIAEGRVKISDVDAGDDPRFDQGARPTPYGKFELDEGGEWRYQLDSAAVGHLTAGEQIADTIILTATDGTVQNIVISIAGPDPVVVDQKLTQERSTPVLMLDSLLSSLLNGGPDTDAPSVATDETEMDPESQIVDPSAEDVTLMDGSQEDELDQQYAIERLVPSLSLDTFFSSLLNGDPEKETLLAETDEAEMSHGGQTDESITAADDETVEMSGRDQSGIERQQLVSSGGSVEEATPVAPLPTAEENQWGEPTPSAMERGAQSEVEEAFIATQMPDGPDLIEEVEQEIPASSIGFHLLEEPGKERLPVVGNESMELAEEEAFDSAAVDIEWDEDLSDAVESIGEIDDWDEEVEWEEEIFIEEIDPVEPKPEAAPVIAAVEAEEDAATTTDHSEELEVVEEQGVTTSTPALSLENLFTFMMMGNPNVIQVLDELHDSAQSSDTATEGSAVVAESASERTRMAFPDRGLAVFEAVNGLFVDEKPVDTAMAERETEPALSLENLFTSMMMGSPNVIQVLAELYQQAQDEETAIEGSAVVAESTMDRTRMVFPDRGLAAVDVVKRMFVDEDSVVTTVAEQEELEPGESDLAEVDSADIEIVDEQMSEASISTLTLENLFTSMMMGSPNVIQVLVQLNEQEQVEDAVTDGSMVVAESTERSTPFEYPDRWIAAMETVKRLFVEEGTVTPLDPDQIDIAEEDSGVDQPSDPQDSMVDSSVDVAQEEDEDRETVESAGEEESGELAFVGISDDPLLTMDPNKHLGEDLSGKVTEDGIGKVEGVISYHGKPLKKDILINGRYGTFTADKLGHWTFTLNHSTVQHLDDGDQVEETFTVAADYRNPHQISVTIYGTEDMPTLSGNTGTVQEDRVGTAEGVLVIADVDEGDAPYFEPVDTTGVYGSLMLDASGGWSYQLDHSAVQNLDEGSYITDSIHLTMSDGSRHAIILTINGTEDQAMVGGNFEGEVTEDGLGTASGLLRIMDTDYEDSPIFEAGQFTSNYGVLDLDEEGYWSYELDHAAVQSLNEGEVATDTLRLTATDDTQQEIVITIHGAKDFDLAAGDELTPLLTLEDIVSYVIKGHPEVVEAREEIHAMKQTVNYAMGGFLPTVELNANSGQELGEEKGNMELKLTQSLFSGFSTRNEVAEAEADYELAKTVLDTVENDVTFRTVQAYMDLIRTRELLKLQQNHLNAHKKVYQQIELRFIQGVGNPSELSQVESMLSNAEATIITAETEYADAVARYEALADEIPSNIERPTLEVEMPESKEKALEYAYMQNAGLRNRRLAIDQAQATHELSKSAFFPTLSFELVGNWDRKAATPDQETDLSAMLRMNYLLFNGNRDRSLKLEAAHRINVAMEGMDTARRNVTQELSLAWHAYERQRKLVPFLTDRAVANRKTLETYKKQYKLQKSTLMEILGGETEMLGSESALLNAENDLYMAQFRILMNIGVLDMHFGF